MKIADFREAAMEWTVTVEGADEYGEMQRAQLRIEKGFERLTSGEARACNICSGAAGLSLL
jgi:hypothetical protein